LLGLAVEFVTQGKERTIQAMTRTKKAHKTVPTRRKSRTTDSFYLDDADEQDLPIDEAGRLKIKRHYEELLGIRLEKLKGRVLNREKINKSIEGVYFICGACKKVCHNLDEGLIQDLEKQQNLCSACAKGKRIRGTPV
jgi:hypothetical protein